MSFWLGQRFRAATFDAYWRPMYVYDVMCGAFCMPSLLCYAHRLGIGSRELAIMLPAVLLCYEFPIGWLSLGFASMGNQFDRLPDVLHRG